MSYLIDTDWGIDYLAGRRPAIELLESIAPEGLAISVLTVYESYEGIFSG